MEFDAGLLSSDRLLQIVRMQSEIARFGLDLGGVMQFVVDHVPALIAADGAAIELAEGDEMVYRAGSGMAAPQIGLRLKVANSMSGRSVITGEILRCDDSETDAGVDRAATRAVGLRSMIIVPLKHRDSTVGILKAMSAQPDKFTDADVAVLGMLCEIVAASMHFSTLYSRDDLFIRATQDGLTGLGNRALFMDRLRTVLAHSVRTGTPFSILIIDLDGLKAINDNIGHRAGDAALVEFASRLKAAARGTDIAARLGGDEFALLLTPIRGQTGVDEVIQRLRSTLSGGMVFEGRHLSLRASMGAATAPMDGQDMLALLELADQRMYADKRQRKADGAEKV